MGITQWSSEKKPPAWRFLTQPFIQAKMKKKKTKALHSWPFWGAVNSPHQGPVTRKMFPFDDVIVLSFQFTSIYWKMKSLGTWKCVEMIQQCDCIHTNESFANWQEIRTGID